MTRLVRLTRSDVQRIQSPRQRPGVLLQYRFVVDEGADPKDWVLSDWGDALRGLPSPREAKTFEIWATHTQKTIATWTPDRATARQVASLMHVFNPEVEPVMPGTDFPGIRSGSFARVGQLRPLRNAHYPIEHRFSRQTQRTLRYGAGLAGQVSPIHHLLASIPPIPEGSTLVIQIAYHKNPYYWRLNPWTHLGIVPLGHDEEALEEKRRHRTTYYADIRLLEIHQDRRSASVNLVKAMAHAYGIYEWSRANRLQLQGHILWSRRRIASFLGTMRDRDARRFRLKRRNRPHYTDRELAALIHPPPAGTQIQDLPYTRVTPQAASSTSRSRANAYQEALHRLDAGKDRDTRQGRGRVRQATNQDIREQLRRLRHWEDQS